MYSPERNYSEEVAPNVCQRPDGARMRVTRDPRNNSTPHSTQYTLIASSSKNIHKTVINFFVLSTVMLQFFLMTLIAIRTETFAQFKLDLSSKSTVSCLFFFLSVNVYSSSLWAETCKKLNPVEFVERTYFQEEDDARGTKTYAPVMITTSDQRELIERRREN